MSYDPTLMSTPTDPTYYGSVDGGDITVQANDPGITPPELDPNLFDPTGLDNTGEGLSPTGSEIPCFSGIGPPAAGQSYCPDNGAQTTNAVNAATAPGFWTSIGGFVSGFLPTFAPTVNVGTGVASHPVGAPTAAPVNKSGTYLTWIILGVGVIVLFKVVRK